MELDLTVCGKPATSAPGAARPVTRDVRITASGATPLRVIAEALKPYFADADRGLWVGSRQLPTDAEFGALSLRPAATIVLGDGRPNVSATVGAVVRLHVVGGPNAGRIVALPRGESTIGRAPSCSIGLTDERVSRAHLAISITATGIRVRDLGSTNGTVLDGQPVDQSGVELAPGQHLRLGDSTLTVVINDELAATVTPTVDGTLRLHRVPRSMVRPSTAPIDAPVSAGRTRPPPGQILAAVLPAAAGAGFAIATGQLAFLVFALAGPCAFLVPALIERRRQGRARRAAQADVHARTETAAAELAQRLPAEIHARRESHPDPATVLRAASLIAARVWQRRRADPDFLDIGVGLADQDSHLRTRTAAGRTVAAGLAGSVPVIVRLQDGPLGICGPREARLAAARWAIGQLAVLHSPADISIVLIAADDAVARWSWLRWLPHQRGPGAVTPKQRNALVATLTAEFERRRTQPGPTVSGPWRGPWTVLVVDADPADADLAECARLLEAGSTVGLTAVWIGENKATLPSASVSVATVEGEFGTRLGVETAERTRPLVCLADHVDLGWADAVARALAPLRDPVGAESSELPAQCRLLELYGPNATSPDAIAARWHDGGRPVAIIGRGADGPVTIDLAQDGPHALVAGTTGAGKSELLRSLVTALALANSPQDLSFILIDYKGGAAFAECAGLPHTVGLVTDLDPQLAERALRSLNAELRRRETLFALVGAMDLDAYRTSPRARTEPVARLAIVVDEFATLADELPDLIGGLLAIARRGRSLGVHLVLATQRPGGVVSPEIQANLALRIALRCIDPAESMAVIGTSAAAAIHQSLPGRAIVRSGTTTREFQTAQIGQPITAASAETRIELLDSWRQLIVENEPLVDAGSDLRALVDSMQIVWTTQAGSASPRRPWLPPLPISLTAHDLGRTDASHRIAIGLVDRPDEQSQETARVDLFAGDSLFIAGGPRSGRTNTLLAIAGAAIEQLPPSALQFYTVDCAGGGLSSLAPAAYCGAALTRDEPEAISRLLARLTDEISSRLRAQRLPADFENCPALMLLIDGWENFIEACDRHEPGVLVDTLHTLLRDASSARLTIAVTAGPATISSRLATAITHTYALLGGPASPPGRAIGVADGNHIQFVLAQPVPTQPVVPVPPAGPIRLQPLPARLRRSDLPATLPAPGTVVLGVGGDAADLVTVDLLAGAGRWLIAGPTRSGRTSLLAALLTQLHSAHFPVVVAAGDRSELANLAAQLGVTVLRPSTLASARPISDDAVVLVDDCAAFDDAPAAPMLRGAIERSGQGRSGVVVSARSDDLATSYRGLAAVVREAATGVLLRPGPNDGDLLGVRLPRVRSTFAAGRGYLVADLADQPQLTELMHGRAALPVQIAL